MKYWHVLMVLVLSFGAQAHADVLNFRSGSLRLRATWTQGPQEGRESKLRLEWLDTQDAATEAPGPFEVKIVMPSMPEMHNPATRVDREAGTDGRSMLGVYRVSHILFTMGGDWDVTVIVRYPDHTSESQSLHLDLP